jgi:DNA-binding response OmpR family regulator
MVSIFPSDNTRQDSPLARLLIVDDEPLVSWSLANALKKVGYDVTIVSSGEEAVQILPTKPFDVVITDVDLPKLSGLELARAVREHAPHLPIVLMSALDDRRQPGASQEPLFDRFIEKPFQMQEMIDLVEEVRLHAPETRPAQN